MGKLDNYARLISDIAGVQAISGKSEPEFFNDIFKMNKKIISDNQFVKLYPSLFDGTVRSFSSAFNFNRSLNRAYNGLNRRVPAKLVNIKNYSQRIKNVVKKDKPPIEYDEIFNRKATKIISRISIHQKTQMNRVDVGIFRLLSSFSKLNTGNWRFDSKNFNYTIEINDIKGIDMQDGLNGFKIFFQNNMEQIISNMYRKRSTFISFVVEDNQGSITSTRFTPGITAVPNLDDLIERIDFKYFSDNENDYNIDNVGSNPLDNFIRKKNRLKHLWMKFQTKQSYVFDQSGAIR